jgi:hypothetical protein
LLPVAIKPTGIVQHHFLFWYLCFRSILEPDITMPKRTKNNRQFKSQAPKVKRAATPCPNPCCASNKTFTRKQFSHHLTHYPACREFIRTHARKDPFTSQPCINPLVASLPSDNNPAFPPTELADSDVDFVQQDDNDSESDWQQAPTPPPSTVDYERYNFDMLAEPKEHFILNPDAAVFKNARRVEVILLKILTELQAPLWAFQHIMDWAFDAYQTGYNFLPDARQQK